MQVQRLTGGVTVGAGGEPGGAAGAGGGDDSARRKPDGSDVAHGGGDVGASGGNVPAGGTDSTGPRVSGEGEQKNDDLDEGSDSTARAHWKKLRAEVRESHDSFGDSPPTSTRASGGSNSSQSRSPASRQRVSTYGQADHNPFQRDGSRRHSEMLARSSAD